MLEAYRQHVAERAEIGIPPLPLNAKQTAELVEQDFMQTVFPHPTISESMHESVLAAYGRALHI